MNISINIQHSSRLNNIQSKLEEHKRPNLFKIIGKHLSCIKLPNNFTGIVLSDW